MTSQAWFVSRQCYFPDGDLVVEIAGGGLDFSNPDMLGVIFPELGEGIEYTDPREALKAALAIRDAWNICLEKGREEDRCRVEHGYTGGYTMPFHSEPTDEELQEWADKEWESLPKCEKCGDLMPESGEHYALFPEDEWRYCSQVCLEETLPKPSWCDECGGLIHADDALAGEKFCSEQCVDDALYEVEEIT